MANSSVTRGCFITFEGGEGAGKSTQCRLLARAIEARGRSVLCTREPGGAPGAEAIRALLVEGAGDRWDAISEALLHFAARRAHLVDTVWPALDRGVWVISDRFADSSMAYQGVGLGLGREPIETLYRLAIGDFQPDLTIILDLPVAVGLARVERRGVGQHQRYERMDRAFHERLRQGFLDIAAREPDRCRLIDGTMDENQVAQAVWRTVQGRWPDLSHASVMP